MTLPLRPLAVALSLLALGAPAMAQTATTDAPAAASADAQTLPDVVLGQADAPLTIVEYASFTCPHCSDFHNKNFDTLKSEYIDTGKVKFIQRDVYFDQFGLWAGIVARCGGDTKYYAVSDMLFAQQKEWMNAKTEADFAANLRKIGKTAGMTEPQLDACFADEGKVKQMIATFQKNAEADKIQGTPTFIIGGEQVANQEWSELKAKIDEKYAEAAAAAPAAPAATN